MEGAIREGQYLNTEDAAKYIGYAPKTLQNWRSAKPPIGPSYLLRRGRALYAIDELDRWRVASTKFVPTSDFVRVNDGSQQPHPQRQPLAACSALGKHLKSVGTMRKRVTKTKA